MIEMNGNVQGYLSEESKQRFTLVAGVLGAVFFFAQFVLPFVAFLLIFIPGMMFQEFRTVDFDRSAIWRDGLWYVERSHSMSFEDPVKQRPKLSLRHAALGDLAEAKETLSFESEDRFSGPTLLADADRLWLLGDEKLGVFENGAIRWLQGGGLPRHASRPFLYRGRPSVLSLGREGKLCVLEVQGDRAQWRCEPITLDPPLVGEERIMQVQAVEVEARLVLVAEVGGRESDERTLYVRALVEEGWRSLDANCRSCSRWTPVALGSGLGILIAERDKNGGERLFLVGEGLRTELAGLRTRSIPRGWTAFSHGKGLLLISEGMPGSRRLAEVVDGKVVREAEVRGGFPFGGGMMVMMTLPQFLPLVLSLLLAFILTVQMRRHRVGRYEAEGQRRTFATLWQRALAQLVDATILGAGMCIAGLWMWRAFSDMERLMEESGPFFVFQFFGLMALGMLWMVATLVVFSYTEGRSGKTPGKWLVGVRVLGTDLRPCGFGRALIRNLLTFADGFFNFLVGILLVALTEQWQRLGDLAARTVVLTDEKADAGGKSAIG